MPASSTAGGADLMFPGEARGFPGDSSAKTSCSGSGAPLFERPLAVPTPLRQRGLAKAGHSGSAGCTKQNPRGSAQNPPEPLAQVEEEAAHAPSLATGSSCDGGVAAGAPKRTEAAGRRLSEASTSATVQDKGLQAHVLAEVMRNLEKVKKRMSDQQDAALRNLQELQQQSEQLEGELERRRRERRYSDATSAAGSRRARRATIATERTEASGARGDLSSTPSTAVRALRRFSTSSAINSGSVSARPARHSLGGCAKPLPDPELYVQRQWMMEQRAILLDDLFPEGHPNKVPTDRTPRTSIVA